MSDGLQHTPRGNTASIAEQTRHMYPSPGHSNQQGIADDYVGHLGLQCWYSSLSSQFPQFQETNDKRRCPEDTISLRVEGTGTEHMLSR